MIFGRRALRAGPPYGRRTAQRRQPASPASTAAPRPTPLAATRNKQASPREPTPAERPGSRGVEMARWLSSPRRNKIGHRRVASGPGRSRIAIRLKIETSTSCARIRGYQDHVNVRNICRHVGNDIRCWSRRRACLPHRRGSPSPIVEMLRVDVPTDVTKANRPCLRRASGWYFSGRRLGCG